jgi:hypothetical protein
MADLHHWPTYVEGQKYVRDRIGVVWLLDPFYDGGIATTATYAGPYSVGIRQLRDLRGPLHILDLKQEILDQFPTIEPEPDLTKPIQEIVATTEAQARSLNT